jgi:hypothetical protein
MIAGYDIGSMVSTNSLGLVTLVDCYTLYKKPDKVVYTPSLYPASLAVTTY